MKQSFCALALFVLWSCAGPTTREVETCAVYRSFYEYWPAEARQQFRFVRQARSHNTNGTRPVESFEPGLIADPHNLHPPRFVEDTSGYFDQLSAEPGAVSDCFPDEGPMFIDASEDPSEILAASDREFSSIWTLSPVAFAPDGQHALMVADMYCGMLCAQEHYVLFERRGSEWTLTGNRIGRIS